MKDAAATAASINNPIESHPSFSDVVAVTYVVVVVVVVLVVVFVVVIVVVVVVIILSAAATAAACVLLLPPARRPFKARPYSTRRIRLQSHNDAVFSDSSLSWRCDRSIEGDGEEEVWWWRVGDARPRRGQ